jgi:Tol biopolymer transport system component
VTPFVSTDGLHLFYSSDASGNYDIMLATRASTATVFGTGAAVAGLNLADLDACPFLSADGKQLYFCSIRAGGLGGADIWVADFGTNGATNIHNLSAVNTSTDEENPVLSPDGLTIYFSSKQTGSKGDYDIWMAKRSTAADGFGQAVAVTELNTDSSDAPTWLSPDGCMLFFASDHGGTSFGLYQATRGQ